MLRKVELIENGKGIEDLASFIKKDVVLGQLPAHISLTVVSKSKSFIDGRVQYYKKGRIVSDGDIKFAQKQGSHFKLSKID